MGIRFVVFAAIAGCAPKSTPAPAVGPVSEAEPAPQAPVPAAAEAGPDWATATRAGSENWRIHVQRLSPDLGPPCAIQRYLTHSSWRCGALEWLALEGSIDDLKAALQAVDWDAEAAAGGAEGAEGVVNVFTLGGAVGNYEVRRAVDAESDALRQVYLQFQKVISEQQAAPPPQ